LKDIDFDWENEKDEKQGLDIRKLIFQVLLGISWSVLAAVAIYLYANILCSLLTILGRSSISQVLRWE
jgi:hypothetical protein